MVLSSNMIDRGWGERDTAAFDSNVADLFYRTRRGSTKGKSILLTAFLAEGLMDL